MSDFGLFVAAALRDKGFQELLNENQQLRDENLSLTSLADNLMQLRIRSPRRAADEEGDGDFVWQRLQSSGLAGTGEGTDNLSSDVQTLQGLLQAEVWLGNPSWFFLDRISCMAVYAVVYSIPNVSFLSPESALVADPSIVRSRHLVQVRIETRWLSIRLLVATIGPLRVDFQDEDITNEVIIIIDGEETVEESLRIDFGESLYSNTMRRANAYVISIHAVGIPHSPPS